MNTLASSPRHETPVAPQPGDGQGFVAPATWQTSAKGHSGNPSRLPRSERRGQHAEAATAPERPSCESLISIRDQAVIALADSGRPFTSPSQPRRRCALRKADTDTSLFLSFVGRF